MPTSGGEKLCPICDSPLAPGSKKCGFCGTDLSIFEIEVESTKPSASEPAQVQQKPSLEARIEEIFSKPLVPEKPTPPAAPRPAPQPAQAPERAPSFKAEVAEPAKPPVPEPPPKPAEAPATAKAEPAAEVSEFFECPECGAHVAISASSCPKCGVLFAEEGTEMFQCPNCNTLVSVDAKSCPGCGALFVEPEEAEAIAAPPVEEKPSEPAVPEAKAPPKPAPPAPAAKPKEEAEEKERKGLFGGLFRKGKKEPEAKPEPPVKAPPVPSPPPKPSGEAARAPAPAVKAEAKAAPVTDKGKELARMVAEMKPLLALAREREVDIAESKELIDEAAVAGRERKLDRAIELVQKSRTVLLGVMDKHLAGEIESLNEEIKLAKGFGGDTARAETYIREVSRAKAAGDVEAAYVYVDKVKNELLPITGRYNESKKKLASMKQLIADAEAFIVDTKEARALLVDANKAMELKDFDRLDALLKAAREKLYKSIPARMNEEIQKAKYDLIEAKGRDVNITPMITLLKSATSLMKAGDYAQALKEMREFKEMMKRAV
ncbi:MAG: hypothetical protein QXJ32_07130 [Thermoplasmata archaeon]